MSDFRVGNIPITDIHMDDNFNCRGAMAPIDVSELAEDIEKNGLHQPVLVMEYDEESRIKIGKRYKLIAGFRRTYAHRILKRDSIIAVIKPQMSDVDARVINLSENLKRKDLNMLQEAKALEALYFAGVPRDRVAEVVKMSSGWVQSRFALLSLPQDIQKEAEAGLLNQYQIKKLASIKNTDKQYEIVRQIKDARSKGESVDHIITREKPKPFDKRQRKKNEILDMIDLIFESLQGNIGTRCLAWAAGEISDLDLYDSLDEYAKTVGQTFKRP